MKMKTAHMGLLLSFALILSYIETLIPFSFGIPGIKLGLANAAVLMCICLLGYKEGLMLAVLKVLLTGLLFGNLFMMLYSFSGAVCSYLVMAIMVRSGRFHIPVISGIGGVFHNMGQLLVAYFVVETYGIWYYMPILIVAGLITGVLTGIVASFALPYVKKIIERRAEI